MTPKILDRAVTLGRRRSLVGILTQEATYKPSDRPVFLILNSGIIHRVGHHRMYVTLARELAAAGYQVLRFDLSGIGDSENRNDGLSPLDGAVADIRDAVEWLATSVQARRFVLLGLCQGADHALVYGSDDPRVAGLVLLDPSIPPTSKFYLLYFARHILRPRSWTDLLLGRGRAWNRLRVYLGSTSYEILERHRLKLGDPIVRSYLQNAYQRSMDLGIQCLAVFTSGFPHQHNYRRQILDAFPTVPFKGQLQLKYFTGCDHVFTTEADRRRLFDTITGWAVRQFTETLAVGSIAAETVAHRGKAEHASSDA